jgi:hypothetical protein
VSKKIAIVFGQMTTNADAKTRLITLNAGELRSWSAEKPGSSVLNLIGSGHTTGEMMGALNHNVRQSTQQAVGTGLRLVTENLDATEIFLNFDFEIAKSWVVLLDKLASGRLEVPTSPTEFPKP